MKSDTANSSRASDEQTNLVISADRVPVAAYQAIYHRLTGRVETITKTYDKSYLVDLENVENLYHRLDQAISQYQVQARNCEFTLSTFEGENYKFTSLEKLKFANLRGQPKASSAFGIDLNFLVILPSEVPEGENIPQRYKVVISVEDPTRVVERHFARPIFSTTIYESNFPTGSASINYTDYAVGRTLLTIVNEWFEEIRFRDEATISKMWRDRLKKSGSWAAFAIPLSAFVAGIVFEPGKYADILTPMRYLLVVLFLVFMALAVAVTASDKLDQLVDSLASRTTFDLTRGDQKNRTTRLTQRYSARKIIGLLFGAIVLATAVGIFSNFISAKLFGI